METTKINERRILLLQDTRGFFKTLNISHRKTLHWRKQKIDVSPLQETELPAYFIVKDKKLVRYNDQFLQENRQKIIGSEEDKDVILNNMEIMQGRTEVQKLDEANIENLRKRESGEGLIDLIATNNKNFEKRTKFSKQKYLDKKKKKYLIIFRVEELTMENANSKILTFILINRFSV
jgi:hypothetical protein